MTLVRLNNGYGDLPGYRNLSSWMDSMMRESLSERRMLDVPQANIIETEKSFLIEMAIPGYRKEEVKIIVENNVLTISHEQDENQEENDIRMVRREFRKNPFSRSFRLSRWIESDKIEAKFENGVLTVKIPKKEEAIAKPVREIEIK